jgi:hypothetical protein
VRNRGNPVAVHASNREHRQRCGIDGGPKAGLLHCRPSRVWRAWGTRFRRAGSRGRPRAIPQPLLPPNGWIGRRETRAAWPNARGRLAATIPANARRARPSPAPRPGDR